MKHGPLLRLRTAPALFTLLVCSLVCPLRCQAADPPTGAVVVAIRTASENADAVKLTEWETFTLVMPAAVSVVEGPPANSGSGPSRPSDETGRCFAEPKESNPANLFMKWTCGPLFDPKTATADIVTHATLDFLTKYADLWQLKNPAQELKRRYAQPNWDVEFQQWNGGVRVFNTDIHVSFISGVPSWVRSDYIPGLDSLNKAPKLSGAQAIEVARKHLAASAHIPIEAIRGEGKPMLGISAAQRDEPARPPRLIYRLTLMFSGRIISPSNGYGTECQIDAHTGEVVNESYLRPLTARPIR